MPDPIRIRCGSARKRWPEAGPMILAHRLASRLEPFGQATPIKSGPVLLHVIRAFFGRTETNRLREVGSGMYYFSCTLAVMAINGRNQNASESDPACLLGSCCVYSGHLLGVLGLVFCGL